MQHELKGRAWKSKMRTAGALLLEATGSVGFRTVARPWGSCNVITSSLLIVSDRR